MTEHIKDGIMPGCQYILGLIFGGVGPAACLLKDGEIVAFAEEERFNRVKHANGSFPISAIKFCLEYAKIPLDKLYCITFGWDCEKYGSSYMKEFYDSLNTKYEKDERTHKWENWSLNFFNPKNIRDGIKNELMKGGIHCEIPEIRFIPHHLSHAASAFYLSGFDEAVVMTLDGSGEENCTVLWYAKGNNIKKIKEFNIPQSLGWYYSAFTEYLGFKAYSDEYKVMGMAAYGKYNEEIVDKVNRVLRIKKSGDYEVDPYYIYYGNHSYAERFTDKLVNLLGYPPRIEDAEVNDFHKDVAFAAQHLLEEVILNLTKWATRETNCRNICLAGGVAMNCKVNGSIYYSGCADNIFIQPVSSDTGVALGSALVLFNQLTAKKPSKLRHVYYGPNFSNQEVRRMLDSYKLQYKYYKNIEEVTARKIAEGNIVGWFQGRMEVGARALGNRSILADPRYMQSKDKVNSVIKFREMWRPFCPSIIHEADDKYMVNPCLAPFMILTFKFKDNRIKEVPAIVHVDGTVRPQSVERETNPKYWELIKEFEKLTGCGIVLNTSFNVRGEPIVCTPRDAIRCFYSTGMDVLVMGNYMLEKKDIK